MRLFFRQEVLPSPTRRRRRPFEPPRREGGDPHIGCSSYSVGPVLEHPSGTAHPTAPQLLTPMGGLCPGDDLHPMRLHTSWYCISFVSGTVCLATLVLGHVPPYSCPPTRERLASA